MKNITMQVIAEKAGISRHTVSRVLNNKNVPVKEETRARILKIARELDFKPNYFANALKKGRTPCIGVMGSLSVPKFDYHYFSATVSAIEKSMEQQQAKYSLLIFGTNNNGGHEQTMDLIQKGILDGLILIILSSDLAAFEKTMLPVLRNVQVPFVVVHSLSQSMPFNNVGLDSLSGGYLAAQHLVNLGHRRIHYYQAENSPLGQAVQAGFKQALDEAGLAFTEKEVIRHDASLGDTVFKQTCEAVRRMPEVPRALFVDSDATAYGILKGLRERGVAVPEQTAIVGFNDEQPAPYFESELTTVHHPYREKGAAAVGMLLSILDGTHDRDSVHQQVLKPSLVVRKTCGARQG